MNCPRCTGFDVRVLDARAILAGAAVRRRRACESCGHRWTTIELPALFRKGWRVFAPSHKAGDPPIWREG